MKRFGKGWHAAVAGLLLFASPLYAGVSRFDDNALEKETHWGGAGSGETGFESGDFKFPHTADAYSWDGFAYSNTTDVKTEGYLNQFSAITGGGVDGSANYALAYCMLDFKTGTYEPIPVRADLKDGVSPRVVSGVYVTNTTYGYLAIKDGYFVAEKFGGDDGTDPDWYYMEIRGVNAADEKTAPIRVYLADYRSDDPAKDYILDSWKWVDLTSLGEVKALEFTVNSSDRGNVGINTPAYFAIDNLDEAGFKEGVGLAKESHWIGSEEQGFVTENGFRYASQKEGDKGLWTGFAMSTHSISGERTEWQNLSSLAIGDLRGFALGRNGDKVELGVMCKTSSYDPGIKLPAGFGGDPYCLVLHKWQQDALNWAPYGGRTTPQTYIDSELVFDNGNSYYTTNYRSWGGLLSVVRNGGAGAYALSGTEHDIAFLNGKLYDMVKMTGGWGAPSGFSLSYFPVEKIPGLGGAAPDEWKHVIIDSDQNSVSDPSFITAGDALVAAYMKNKTVIVRKTATPDAVTGADDFTAMGPDLTGVKDVELAWDGSFLYLATIAEEDGALTIRKADISVEDVSWEIVRTIQDAKADEMDLCKNGAGIALALRSGDTVSVYENVMNEAAGFSITGDFVVSNYGRMFDIESDGARLVFSAYDETTKKLNTFSPVTLSGAAYTAVPKNGVGGTVAYAVGRQKEGDDTYPELGLATPGAVPGVYVTNVAEVYEAMKKDKPEWVRLTATGLDADGATTGTSTMDLANFASDQAQEQVLCDRWQWMDLSGLGTVAKIRFAVTAASGETVPAAFCLDRPGSTGEEDLDGDGVADNAAVNTLTDLDGDGISDSLQKDVSVIRTADGKKIVAMSRKEDDKILGVESIKAVKPDTLGDAEKRPELPFGVLDFSLAVEEGATVAVTFYLSEAAPENAKWFKYSAEKGWTAYEHAVFTAMEDGRTKVVVTLTDGGEGDDDGKANGVIVDPSGVGVIKTDGNDNGSGNNGGNNGNSGNNGSGENGSDSDNDSCFISTISGGSGHAGFLPVLLVLGAFFVMITRRERV